MGFFEDLMGTAKDATKSAAVDLALKGLRIPAGAFVKDYATINELAYRDGKLVVRASLLGNEDNEFEITAGMINIDKDGKTIQLGQYSSNVKGIENLLNAYGTRPVDVPVQAQSAMKMLRNALV